MLYFVSLPFVHCCQCSHGRIVQLGKMVHQAIVRLSPRQLLIAHIPTASGSDTPSSAHPVRKHLSPWSPIRPGEQRAPRRPLRGAHDRCRNARCMAVCGTSPLANTAQLTLPRNVQHLLPHDIHLPQDPGPQPPRVVHYRHPRVLHQRQDRFSQGQPHACGRHDSRRQDPRYTYPRERLCCAQDAEPPQGRRSPRLSE